MNRRFSLMKLSLAAAAACLWSGPASAEEAVAQPYPSTEQNLREMDTNKDGMVSVLEVRAALEARHGKDYEKAALDDLVARASGRSCSTPFAQNFY